MNDNLGDRMKRQYEDRTRYALPRRTYTIIRVDGKAFHSFTRHMERPFDEKLMGAMDLTARDVCANLQGCKLAFVQSDEISFLLTDFDSIATDALYDGNVQKIASIAASFTTGIFNSWFVHNNTEGFFDARVFTIPDIVEVENYFIWRQQDATRNSIQMAAQALYSHSELFEKNVSEQQEMIFAKGINWNDYPVGSKRGRVLRKRQPAGDDPRTGWRIDEPPVFTQDRGYLRMLIPPMPTWA